MARMSIPSSQRPRILSEEEKRYFDSRQSTFNVYPQHLFPTSAKFNKLPSNFETPHVYSHHQSAFYWTRQDALDALIWNYPTRPPCLNCVLLGEAVAKRCDRMERQWRSQGQVRCCKRCETAGHENACVEMVEIRVVHKFVPTSSSGRVFRPRCNKYGVDMFLWTDEERALRKQGRVVWRPLNLETGDVDTKQKLAAEFAAGGAGDITRFCISSPILRNEMSSSEYRAWWVAQRMMKRKISRWDREEAEPESGWASQLDGMIRTQARPTGTKTDNGGVQLSEDPGDSVKEQAQTQTQLLAEIEAQRQQWMSVVREARQVHFEHDLRGEAQNSEGQAQFNGPKLMDGIRDFFKEKQLLLERGRKKGWNEKECEQNACWESARLLDGEVRNFLEDIVPGMLLPVDTTDAVEMQ